MKCKIPLILFCTIFTWLEASHNANAQYSVQKPSSTSVMYAKNISRNCLGQWGKQSCLKAISDSNLVMIVNYGEYLKKQGKIGSLEKLEEHCAASTAARNGRYPANVMQSALRECTNIISNIASDTNIIPDQSHYQLLVGAIICLSKDRQCQKIEAGLKRYTQ